MKYALFNNQRIIPTKNVNEAICPICGEVVIPKCGKIKINAKIGKIVSIKLIFIFSILTPSIYMISFIHKKG